MTTTTATTTGRIRPRGNRFQADTLIDGKRVRRGFPTEAAAIAWLKQVQAGSAGTPNTLAAYIDAVFDRLWGDTKRPDASRINCDVLLRYFSPDMLVSEMTTARVEGLVSRMKADGKSNATINRKLSTLSKLLKYAERIEILDKRPHIDFLRESEGRDRVLSDEEEQKLIGGLRHYGMHDAADLVVFLLDTGCRVSEALKLTYDDVGGGKALFRDTKNGEDRIVPLTSRARSTIAVASSPDQWGPWGNYSIDTFRTHWDRVREHMGLRDDPGFVPHMLRHTCATRLVRGGVDLPRVMRWMGHKNIQTTMRYSHLAPKDLDVALNVLERKVV